MQYSEKLVKLARALAMTSPVGLRGKECLCGCFYWSSVQKCEQLS